MKKIIFVLCLSVCSWATQAQSKDETAVTNAVEALKKAMIDADKTALENLAADGLSYGHSSGKVEDKAEFVRAIVSGESDFVTIDLTEQTIKIVGNSAIVRHKLFAKTNNKGQAGTANIAILLVWQKQKGQWKLLARQAVKL
ncbi:nuclear transport factor 2 family protein [Runella sp. SP2]|uniref:nuclear transport factor 2 family protein n=1 Tax=Runella sp. SP2 TaxID=2268026 RepID=UPI000F0807D0|nr:nuclear transport factor 2 family protein [Runella sp. SP2]AYQ34555.1 nuclear transport factor 2 family protein [Runella sp. SP2]